MDKKKKMEEYRGKKYKALKRSLPKLVLLTGNKSHGTSPQMLINY